MYFDNITNSTTLYFVNDGTTDYPYYEISLDVVGTNGTLFYNHYYTNLSCAANSVDKPVTFKNFFDNYDKNSTYVHIKSNI